MKINLKEFLIKKWSFLLWVLFFIILFTCAALNKSQVILSKAEVIICLFIALAIAGGLLMEERIWKLTTKQKLWKLFPPHPKKSAFVYQKYSIIFLFISMFLFLLVTI
jgi:hypothetical protein